MRYTKLQMNNSRMEIERAFAEDNPTSIGMTMATHYSAGAMDLAVFPGKGGMLGILYATLKLTGEAGEVSEKIGKMIRDAELMGVHDDTAEDAIEWREFTTAEREAILHELGDVLWYVNAIAVQLNSSLPGIQTMNMQKLLDRKNRNKLHGSGDER